MSANQLSVYGAVADTCTEVSLDTMASRKPQTHAAQDPLETMGIPTEPPTAELQEYGQQFEQQSDAQKLSKLCANTVWKLSKED